MANSKNDNTLRTYYDIIVSNINSNSLSIPNVLSYTENRNGDSFVTQADNYLFSIVRFSLESNNLPIFFAYVQSNQSDINLSIYSVSMVYNNQTVQSYIIYIPQDKTANIPSSPSSNLKGLQTYSEYYYVYNYEYFIYLINTALTTCFNSLAALTTLPTSIAPYFKWNTSSNTATLITDSAGFNDMSSNYIQLYFNNALFNLFESLPSFTINESSSKGLIYQISCSSYGMAEQITSGTTTYLSCNQEFSTISTWNPVTSIIFTTTLLSIKSESLGAPLIYLDNYSYQSTNNKNIAGIISDFQPSDNIYKPYVNYQPTVIRYIELVGSQAVDKIDINVFWKNRFGELVPFKLNPSNSLTVKVCFSRIFTQN